jgi:hypothetical protein
MRFTIHYVTVNLRVKRGFYLGSSPRKLNHVAAVGNLDGLKSEGREPGGNGLNVRIGGAELLPELDRRKPFVKGRRGSDLLLNQQILQRGLLVGSAFQHEQNPVHRQIGWRRALVVLRARERMRAPGESSQPRNVDSVRNPRADGIALRRRGEWCDKHQSPDQHRGPAELRKSAAKIADRSRKDVSAARGLMDVRTAEWVIHVSLWPS